MDDRLRLRIGQCADRRLDHGELPAFLRALFADGTEHFQSHNGGAVFAEDNVIDAVAFRHPIDEKSSQAFPRDLDRRHDGGKALYIRAFKAERGKIHILLRGQHGKQTFVQHRIDEASHLIADQLLQKFSRSRRSRKISDSKDLSLAADYQNVGSENLSQHTADIIEHNLTGIIVVQQFPDFPCFIQQLNATHLSSLRQDASFVMNLF